MEFLLSKGLVVTTIFLFHLKIINEQIVENILSGSKYYYCDEHFHLYIYSDASNSISWPLKWKFNQNFELQSTSISLEFWRSTATSHGL